MKDVVNQALVADGYEFTDQNTRGRYLGTIVAKRRQFLKDYRGKWRKVSDVLEKAAQHAPYANTVVKADPVTSSLPSKASDPENDVGKATAELSANTASLPDLPKLELVSPMPIVPSLPTIVRNALTINGRLCITTEQFARLSGISKRTLHRLFKNGNGPPKIKISDTLYELDEALKWSSERRHRNRGKHLSQRR